MTDGVDPRLARRRREVQEASARRRLRWMIWLLAIALLAGLVIAIFQSSWLAVSSITVEGADRADVEAALSEAGVEEGMPIVSVRAGSIEEALRRDPWVAEAGVRVVWPRSIEISVVEHIPIARVKSGASWVIASTDGAVVARGQRIVDPLVDIEVGQLAAGDQIEDSTVLGAIEFVAALPVELKDELSVRVVAGELEAVVAGRRVLLGVPMDMAQKAVTLAVLLDEQNIAPDATISLVSPMRPAVTNPEAEVEGLEEVSTQTTGSG